MNERLPEDQQTQRRERIDLKNRRAPADRIPFPPSANPPEDRDKTQQHQPVTSVSELTKKVEVPKPAPDVAPAQSGLYLPWWAFVVVIGVVAGITCGLWGWVLLSRGDISTSLGPTPTPIFVVITSTATLGPEGEEGDSPDPTATLPGFPTATLQPVEGDDDEPTPSGRPVLAIQIDSTVMVTGTEGTGLAIRQGPGTEYSFFFVGNDGERFRVEDGPRDASGYTWWYVVDPQDGERAGWVVEDFLQVLPN